MPHQETNNVRILPGTHLYTWVESSNVDKVSCWRTKVPGIDGNRTRNPLIQSQLTFQSNKPRHLHVNGRGNCSKVSNDNTYAPPFLLKVGATPLKMTTFTIKPTFIDKSTPVQWKTFRTINEKVQILFRIGQFPNQRSLTTIISQRFEKKPFTMRKGGCF